MTPDYKQKPSFLKTRFFLGLFYNQSNVMKTGQYRKGHTNERASKLPNRTLPHNLNRTVNNCDGILRRFHTSWRILDVDFCTGFPVPSITMKGDYRLW